MSLKSVVLLLAGLLFLGASATAAWRTSRFVADSVVADGRVSALRAGGSHPQIEFTTAAGERISYPQNGLVFGARVGEAVRVRYDPAEPRTSASLDRFGALWTVPLTLLFVSTCLFIGAYRNRRTDTITAGRYG